MATDFAKGCHTNIKRKTTIVRALVAISLSNLIFFISIGVRNGASQKYLCDPDVECCSLGLHAKLSRRLAAMDRKLLGYLEPLHKME